VAQGLARRLGFNTASGLNARQPHLDAYLQHLPSRFVTDLNDQKAVLTTGKQIARDDGQCFGSFPFHGRNISEFLAFFVEMKNGAIADIEMKSRHLLTMRILLLRS
jgi:hypothetical protein